MMKGDEDIVITLLFIIFQSLPKMQNALFEIFIESLWSY